MTDSSGQLAAKSFRVSGRVQGVCYRMYTVDRAEKLGLTGWVRNLPDGDVEVYACGPKEQLEALHQWLHEG
ncbi:MAG: acylphosphatase, partial [Gammaproteobacteria bacterium]|nr:acylphosphatase [Gammaproteobacteria bacterium]